MKPFLIILFSLICISKLQAQAPKDSAKILKLHAPETFKAQFKTTQGDFTIEVYRQWSPLAADRLFQLLTIGHFNNNIVFRATPKYVQFGITDNKKLNFFWDRHTIADEPVVQSNRDSIVSFATGGINNRSAQIFINMKDNQRLDTISFAGVTGFPPVGKVISGMDVARKFNTQYGDDIAFKYQDSIYAKGNAYLIKNFPGLDKIIEAFIIKE